MAVSMCTVEKLKEMNLLDLINFSLVHQSDNPHLRAQIAFALSRLNFNEKNLGMASFWKQETLRLIEERTKKSGDTLEACTNVCTDIGGIPIPQIFHEGTVRRDLEDIPDAPLLQVGW